jgi:hypothetical protein
MIITYIFIIYENLLGYHFVTFRLSKCYHTLPKNDNIYLLIYKLYKGIKIYKF